MAIQTREHLKAKYQSGNKPQAQDYADWLDSFVHQTERGSTVAIPSGGGNIAIAPGELVDKIIITSATAQTISLGTTNGGTEVIDNEPITANAYLLHTEDFFAPNTPITLYLTYATGVIVYFRKTVFT